MTSVVSPHDSHSYLRIITHDYLVRAILMEALTSYASARVLLNICCHDFVARQLDVVAVYLMFRPALFSTRTPSSQVLWFVGRLQSNGPLDFASAVTDAVTLAKRGASYNFKFH